MQDVMAIDEQLRAPDPKADQINVPANPQHYWRSLSSLVCLLLSVFSCRLGIFSVEDALYNASLCIGDVPANAQDDGL